MKDKPDTKKKDSKPDTKLKDKPDTKVKDTPDAKVKDKPDTKVEDNPDIKVKDNPDTKVKGKPDKKVKDNPDTKVKHNPDTKVKYNPDIKVKDKEDTESSASKNYSPKSLSNGKPTKRLDCIKKIFKCFVCEKIINEKFRIRVQNKDGIILTSIIKPDKHSKITHGIATYRDVISLNTEKGLKQVNSICLEDKQIILKASQEHDNSEIQKILDMPISIYNDKIISNISMMTNDNHKNFRKNIDEEIVCTNKIRYMLLMNVMCCLIKVCKKKETEDSEKKKQDEDSEKKNK